MKSFSLQTIVVLTVWMSAAGCTVDTTMVDPLWVDETVAENTQALGVSYVGIIPDGSACPLNSELIRISMDDEDHNNDSAVSGWVGACLPGTTFFFCRVDGSQFHPLEANADDPVNHYAVLKLSETCPEGSEEFIRFFDNEDRRNQNSSIGNIYPNAVDGNTTLHFCLFRAGGTTMREFPDLGIHYGVFAASNFSKAIERGVIRTDDEDKRNKNHYTAATLSLQVAAQRIISDGRNTILYTAQVR